MIQCENKDILLKNAPELMIKEQKVVYKYYNNKGEFVRSYIIPTDKYPLNSDDIHVFCEFNTDELTEQKVLDIFDRTPYKKWHCYTNAESLYLNLIKAGIEDVKLYCGWIVRNLDVPIHHSWVLYKDKYVLDLSNDKYRMYNYFLEKNTKESLKSMDSLREAMADFFVEYADKPNSDRCYPVGVAVENVYIGCEIKSADEGRKIYNDLMRKYPNHEIENNLNAFGKNKLQVLMEQRGVL